MNKENEVNKVNKSMESEIKASITAYRARHIVVIIHWVILAAFVAAIVWTGYSTISHKGGIF